MNALTQIVIFMVLLINGAVLGQDYDSFIDPYSVDNTFHLDCGTDKSLKMHILYRGDAYKVFSARNSSCVAEETEPGHFEIADAMTIPECMPLKNAALKLYSLELIIQKGLVRQYNDPTHIVTCNYEMGGVKTSLSKNTDDTEIARQAVFQQANLARNASAPMTMAVKDAKGKVVTTAYVGSYIQIEMDMTSIQDEEESFRPWNCKATAKDADDTLHVHWFLLRGCGEGEVIKRDRGFFATALEMNSTSVVKSQAKSIYFRAFSLTNVGKITFECNYIVKDDGSALGASCSKSPRFNSRKRRAVDTISNDLLNDGSTEKAVSEAMGLPAVVREIFIVPRPGYPLLPKAVSSAVVPRRPTILEPFVNRAPGYMTMEEARRAATMMKYSADVTKQPMVIGLIIGIVLAVILLIAVSILSVYLSGKLMKPVREPSQCCTYASPIVRSLPPKYKAPLYDPFQENAAANA